MNFIRLLETMLEMHRCQHNFIGLQWIMHSTIVCNYLWLLFCVFNPACIMFFDVLVAERKLQRVEGHVLRKEDGRGSETEPGLRIGEVRRVDSSLPQCVKLGSSEPIALHSDGDVVIGGFFPLHYVATDPQYSYKTKPEITSCSG